MNPFLDAKKIPAAVPPTILTIFGATGDLAGNYLLPALYNLDSQGFLPENFRLVCVGRRDFSDKQYLDFILQKSHSLRLRDDGKPREHFLKRLVYYKGDFGDIATFQGLEKVLSDGDETGHQCANRLYYFATSPEFFSTIANILKRHGLLNACRRHERESRILVEKPFGFDLRSARALNRVLLKYFSEDQIYRIDHYQGKETVQNLMVVRFANSLFEPLWNRNYIDHIEVSVLYDDKIGARTYFDRAGMLRDAIQNHVLEMLALILMDEPKELMAEYVRDEKVKVLKALRQFRGLQRSIALVRGQYRGYKEEIQTHSAAETFVALKCFVNNARWLGVPIYLRTGKALTKKVTEISIHFKELPRCLFKNCAANILIFRIQPDESVRLRINNKIPGFGVELSQTDLNFGYSKEFTESLPPAYERLLLDFMQGDQRLFIRSDEIEAAWKFIDAVRKNWDNIPLYQYEPGATGPKAADELIQADGREWFTK